MCNLVRILEHERRGKPIAIQIIVRRGDCVRLQEYISRAFRSRNGCSTHPEAITPKYFGSMHFTLFFLAAATIVAVRGLPDAAATCAPGTDVRNRQLD